MGRYRCEPVSTAQANSFIDEHHRQGSIGGASISIGLYLRDSSELIGVLQMGPVRTAAMAREYSLELYRLAFKRGIRAPGGASKLIKSYISLYNPSDFFTYQDTTGENTAVYSHSGMVLVRDGLRSKKQYLVAPGRTLESGTRKEVLGMAYATRFGPDRILGTSLGEVYSEATGKRKSNRDIFLEDLGWHIEETSGDSVWEWINPEYSFYTYRITASDSRKYYYGVHGLKVAFASIEDCLMDGYFGSGGAKFSNWKSRHSRTLKKEVLSIYSRKAHAYSAEKVLVGDSFKSDPLCLNSIVGGPLQPYSRSTIGVKYCEIHGETKHNGSTCLKCSSAERYTSEICEIHGASSFFGEFCQKCTSLASKTIRVCPVHGETKHQGDSCYKCMKKGKIENCSIHGAVIHFGGNCMSCGNEESLHMADCSIHGLTKHRGSTCYKCVNESSITMAECHVHGLTKHRGSACFKCRNSQPAIAEKECPIHGLTKHQGDTCSKCSRGAVVLKECSIHGETKHRGDACFKCAAAKRIANRAGLAS